MGIQSPGSEQKMQIWESEVEDVHLNESDEREITEREGETAKGWNCIF